LIVIRLTLKIILIQRTKIRLTVKIFCEFCESVIRKPFDLLDSCTISIAKI